MSNGPASPKSAREKLRSGAIQVGRLQARTLTVRGTGRLMKRLYPLPRPDDDYVDNVDRYRGGLIQIDTRNYIEWSIYVFGAYDAASVTLLERLVHADSVVFDVGANIGAVTLALARTIGPTGHVHAFEPHPVVRRRLAQNVALNNLDNVTICEFALGATRDRATLFGSTTQNQGGSSLAESDGLSERFEIDILRLDDYASGMDRLDLIKIDVEGADFGVLQGASASLQRWRPAIYVEVVGHHLAHFGATPADVLTFLKHLGYDVWRNETVEGEPYGWRLSEITDSPAPDTEENWLATHPGRAPIISAAAFDAGSDEPPAS